MAGRYKPYPEYKDSGTGWIEEIPSSWNVQRGKFIFHEYNVRSESGDETLLSVSEYYGVKPREEVIGEGDFLSRAESLVGYKKCKKNDLVMNIMLAWKRGLGVSKYDGIVSPAYSVFRFNNTVAPDYMHYLLRTDIYVDHFKTRSTGVIDSRLRLYPESFADVSILLPSSNEQLSISRFLDHETAKIDTLIEKQQQLIQLLKEKRQAVISHAVTKGLNPNAKLCDSGIEWLGAVPEHWKVVALKHLVSAPIIDGPHLTPAKQDEGVPFISAEAISQGHINFDKKWGYISKKDHEIYSRRYCPQKDDILMVKLGATTGVVAMVETDDEFNVWVPLATIRVRKEVSSRFIFYLLQSCRVRDAIQLSWTFGTQQTLGLGTLANLYMPIPSLKEAEDIVALIESKIPLYDESVKNCEVSLQLLVERRAALISAAVTGKIDVRNWVAPQASQPNKEVAA